MDESAQNGSSHPNHRVEERLNALAGRHYGYATRAELLATGLTTRAITYRSRVGRLHRRFPNVYAIGYPRLEPIALAAAAVLAGGPRAALCHGSSAALWDLGRRDWPDPPHVAIPTDRRQPGIRWHRISTLHPHELRVHKGIRTTSAARTILDLAPTLTDPELTRMVNDARIAGWAHEQELLELCERHRKHPGASRLRATLGAAPTRSPFEDRFPAFARRHHLPPYRVNARVAGFEVDVVFDAERVIVELDGWEFHRDHAQFTRDRARDAATLEAGYVTVRLTAAMLGPDHGAETARRLHAILAQRRAELGLK
ncbi:MAG TPA: type IV toxin-antitoxin system AbiEi family antitoxin domain-containing protein [Solirubrobacteraceae bacterium]|nr:type IV toxin-antitoxin system AbiEi family antitoxin domain-containing protein [Solirubrobacteraceae bacterium]